MQSAENETAQSQLQYESDFSPRKIKIALLVAVGQMLSTAMLPFMALAFLLLPMTREFGWTRAEFSLSHSVLLWCGGPANFLCGWLLDKTGVRPMLVASGAIVGVTTVALSFQTGALWQFILLYGLLGIASSAAIGYSKVIAGLFTQHRGKALAILGVESTVAAMGLPFLLNFLIGNYGWRAMFLYAGIAILVFTPLLYLLLDEPGTADRSLRRFSRIGMPDKAKPQSAAPAPTPELPGHTSQQILSSRVFWTIMAATIIGMGPRNGMQPFMVDMLVQKGFTEQIAATYIAAVNLIAPIGTIAGGFLVDRIQNAKIAVPFKVASLLGLFLFAMASAQFGGLWLLWVSAALTGFSFGSARPIGTYLNIRFFGLKAFGFFHGLENMLVFLIMGSFAPLIGLIFDRTGSYQYAYVALCVCLAIGSVLYLLLGPYRYPANIGAVPMKSEHPPAAVAPADRIGPASTVDSPA